MLSRTAVGKQGKFERMSLSNEEIDKMMQELLEHNFKEVRRIEAFLKNKGIDSIEERDRLMPILAERQLTSSFQVWANALDEKIFAFKQGQNRYITKTESEKIEKIFTDALGGEKTPKI